MYKIGDQAILIKEIFSIGNMLYWDGCTIRIEIYSKNGAKVRVEFKALDCDNCKFDGGTPKSFIERTIKEVDLLIQEVEKNQK